MPKNSDEILKFVEPIYRFCLKRLSSRSDAEDLSQEILLCILQGLKRSSVSNLEGYVWRIAHNRYARKTDENKKNPEFLCGEEIISISDENENIYEQETENNDEDFQRIFRLLHTLSSVYREIIVDYYIHGMSTREISSKQKLSVETVKWRLYIGREKMKERHLKMEKRYEKVKMHIMCNGSFNPNQYLDKQLYKSIAKTCYEKPLTIEEISLSTGIPTIYLEDSLDYMLWGDAIEQTGNKYATNFIITSSYQINTMRETLNKSIISKFIDTLLSFISENKKELCEINFYGSHFPLSHLYHILIPVILYSVSEKLEENNPPLKSVRPLRKDGGNGWFIVSEGIERLDENFSGCNSYFKYAENKEPVKFVYYWNGSSFSEELNQTLHNPGFFIDSISPDNTCIFQNDEDKAKAIKNGLCFLQGESAYPAIPIFSQKDYQKFSDILKSCHELDDLWQLWLDSLFKEYRSFTPKRLFSQIAGNVNSFSFNASAFIIKALAEKGIVDSSVQSETFTKNLFMIK